MSEVVQILTIVGSVLITALSIVATLAQTWDQIKAFFAKMKLMKLRHKALQAGLEYIKKLERLNRITAEDRSTMARIHMKVGQFMFDDYVEDGKLDKVELLEEAIDGVIAENDSYALPQAYYVEDLA